MFIEFIAKLFWKKPDKLEACLLAGFLLDLLDMEDIILFLARRLKGLARCCWWLPAETTEFIDVCLRLFILAFRDRI
jgi:hypothetical protein